MYFTFSTPTFTFKHLLKYLPTIIFCLVTGKKLVRLVVKELRRRERLRQLSRADAFHRPDISARIHVF